MARKASPRKVAPKAAKKSKPAKEPQLGPPKPKKDPVFKKDAKGRRYWLVKSEPNSRVDPRSGQDARFSVGDLAHVKSEPWNGVRNYEARNSLLTMVPGDLCLFYHSNCKNPGIVGIAEVVSLPKADLLQFDKKSAYYDAKATPDEPRWWCPDVKFNGLLRRKLSLNELRANSDFQDLYLVKRGRLSVTPVSAKHFEQLLELQKTGKPSEPEEFDCDVSGLGKYET